MTDQEIAKIYNSFPLESRDMSLTEFIAAYRYATNPNRMAADATRMVLGRQEQRTIDLNLRNRGRKG